MRSRSDLPEDDNTLIKLVVAGYTHQQIADAYGVSRQAVSQRLKGKVVSRQTFPVIVDLLPWDLSSVPSRPALLRLHIYKGLRGYVSWLDGRSVSMEDFTARKTLINRLLKGEVVSFREGEKFVYEPRSDAANLVVAWPDIMGEPGPQVRRLLTWNPAKAQEMCDLNGAARLKG
ncbi:sigma factor-like helix-turn-helix DNA-binding protein [Streptomyces sp. NPDC051561]|uniref:sigma factor-like helix-turn-helix DNA-binding protein n=1 Tax=Streptomyces sp. NPDC051561 TaxID=3365658 RepID=UPI0037B01240